MEHPFENVRYIHKVHVGFRFCAEPSFFPEQRREYLSAGFNLITSKGMEYRAFLNHLVEGEIEKNQEFSVVVRGITYRNEKRDIAHLSQRLLEEGDLIYCHINQESPQGPLTGRFRGYWTNLDNRLEIEKGAFLLGKVGKVDDLHRFVNVSPTRIVTEEEFGANMGKIFRTSTPRT